MLTREAHAALVLMAGERWEWSGVASSRPRTPNGHRDGLWAFLSAYAGGVCAFCGEHATEFEACHIVAAGPGRRGFVPSNLAMGCLSCNDMDSSDDGFRNVDYDTIVRPDLIPNMWPSAPELQADGMRAREIKAAELARKRAIRGM